MKIVINLDENVFTRLFDNGVETSSEDREVIDRAVRNGTPLPKGHHDRLIILSESVIKGEQILLSFSCQKWISEMGLSNATVAIIEPYKETEND